MDELGLTIWPVRVVRDDVGCAGEICDESLTGRRAQAERDALAEAAALL